MVQTISAMVSLMIGLSGAGVIAIALMEDWQALRHALLPISHGVLPPLPPHTHRVVGARPARMVRITPASSPLSVVA